MGPKSLEKVAGQVEVAKALRFPDSLEPSAARYPQPVVERGSAQSRCGRQKHKLRGLHLSAYDRFRSAVLPFAGANHLATRHQCGDQLAADELSVWWDSAYDECIHDPHEPLTAVLNRPPNPLVASGKVKNGISETEKTDQLAVLSIADQKAKPSAKALRNRNGPEKRRHPEEISLLCARTNDNQFRVYATGREIIAGGKVRSKLLPLDLKKASIATALFVAAETVKAADGVLRECARDEVTSAILPESDTK
jgi:hypothetical protein